MSVNPEEDFSNYMEHMAAAEMEAAKDQAMIDAHNEWRETTWGGWVVTQLLRLGEHIHPFISAVVEALNDDQSAGARVLTTFLRLSLVAVCIIATMIAGRIVQTLIGEQIEVEQEVVVVEEVSRSRAEKKGIVEGEKELTVSEAKKILGEETVSEALQEVSKSDPKRRGKKQQSGKEKKDQ